MEKSSKRGKIPQSDWPLIMTRYDSGETLASIARTYDCSPPAISYVVSRSRARQPGAPPPPAPPPTEPQLIKASPTEAAATSIVKSQSATPAPANAPLSSALLATGQVRPESRPGERSGERLVWPEAAPARSGDRRDEISSHQANGFAGDGRGGRDANQPGIPPRAALNLPRPPESPAPAATANGDPRRTLHLSLGNASPGNGAAQPVEPQPAERHDFASASQPAPPQTAGERAAPPANPAAQHGVAAPDRGRDGAGGPGFPEARPTAYYGPVQQTGGDGGRRKDGGGSFIDRELRARVDGDIAAFLAAFDAALVEDTQGSRSALREATDRLLRAGARTRIELDRLEARMPLPPRDIGGRGESAWRNR